LVGIPGVYGVSLMATSDGAALIARFEAKPASDTSVADVTILRFSITSRETSLLLSVWSAKGT
jgi:hypothetical protein